ncbi:DUF2510 domain-containing protein [Agromyces protaetiae]|uniref:DUF2510 domain-containing protein n=1 Tax=Agromyces protaetiae TaxID=2509455 RepID=UPI001FB6FFE5|nr:DUF2510 domain-containing protein [Agromyces protaetiae]
MTTPAAWYPDPEDPTQLRWWDGSAWTNHLHPAPAAAPMNPSVTADSPNVSVSPAPITPTDYWLADRNASPWNEVVGEAYRDEEIERALGQRVLLDREVEVMTTAALVPEPDNPHDGDAISVRINDEVVGYIAREETHAYRDAVRRIVASGHRAVTPARIWAVRRRTSEGERLYARVTFAYAADRALIAENDPPSAEYSLLPWGGALQVAGEEQHFDVIRPFVPRDGDGLLLVTLHRLERTLKNGESRDVVEVRLGGERCGELSTTTSRHFLPTIDHQVGRSRVVAAWARVVGSPLGAELKLHAARANELSADWLDGAPITVPRLVPQAAHYSVPGAYIAQRPKTSTEPGRAAAKATGSGCALVLLTVIGVGTAVAAGITQSV